MDIRYDALGHGGGQILFGQDTDGPVGLGFEDFLFRGGPRIGARGEDPVFQVGVRVLIAGLAKDVIGPDEFCVWEDGFKRDREKRRAVHLARPPCLIESRINLFLGSWFRAYDQLVPIEGSSSSRMLDQVAVVFKKYATCFLLANAFLFSDPSFTGCLHCSTAVLSRFPSRFSDASSFRSL